MQSYKSYYMVSPQTVFTYPRATYNFLRDCYMVLPQTLLDPKIYTVIQYTYKNHILGDVNVIYSIFLLKGTVSSRSEQTFNRA